LTSVRKKFNIQPAAITYRLKTFATPSLIPMATKIVCLKDVADIQFDYEDNNYFARFKNKCAVFVTVNQKEHTNIFDIMDGLKSSIYEFEQQLPETITLHYAFDQSESVASRINRFFSNLLQGIILVGLVILLALSFRASMIVMLAIPISIFNRHRICRFK